MLKEPQNLEYLERYEQTNMMKILAQPVCLHLHQLGGTGSSLSEL